MTYDIAVFPGDGIGPEVVAVAIELLRAVEQRFAIGFQMETGSAGGASIDRHGIPLTDSALRLAKESDAVLLGAVGGPKWDDPRAPVRPEQALLALRQELGLFANLRPVRVDASLLAISPLKRDVLQGVDLVVVRELTGGIYFGRPSERRKTPGGREAVDTVCYSEEEITRVLRVAFDLARRRRHKVTSVDKANILSTSRLWREIAHEVANTYPDVLSEDILVDAMAIHLLRRPGDFDVIVTENMFGDILTDEASLLVGSLGLLPSAAIGEATSAHGCRRGLYEPVHGSAPDIAGQDRANPLATILSVAMMMRYSIGHEEAAVLIEKAVEATLLDGYRTPDIMQPGCRSVSCREMGELVKGRLLQNG